MTANLIPTPDTNSPAEVDRELSPAVSFIVAAYNVAPFIEEAITSALSQVGVTVEVIVVDDASSDGTSDIVQKIALRDARVKLISLKENIGPGAVRNVALKHASAKWIAILDGDDLLDPNRTTGLLECAAVTGADIVGDNFERVTAEGRRTGVYLFPTANIPFLFQVDAASFIDANQVLAQRMFSLGAIKVIIRSDFLKRHAIMHPEDVPIGEDFQFILSCLFAGARFVVTSSPTYRYRLRQGSQSWRLNSRHMDGLRKVYEDVLRSAEGTGCKRAEEAAAEFGRSLDRTSDFVRAVSLASNGSWFDGGWWVLRHPRIWRLIARFGSQAVMNRLTRLLHSKRDSAI